MSAISREKKTEQILVWVSRHDLPDVYDRADEANLKEAGYHKRPAWIEAVAGKALESGSYRIEAISLDDEAPAHSIGDVFTITDEIGTDSVSGLANWCVPYAAGGTISYRVGTYVTAVTKLP